MIKQKKINFLLFLLLFILINSFICYCDDGIDSFNSNDNATLRHAAQQFINEKMTLTVASGGDSDFAKKAVKTVMPLRHPSGVGFDHWGKNKINTKAIRLFCDEISYPFSYTNFQDCSSEKDLWVKIKVHNGIKHANWTCTETIDKYQKIVRSNDKGSTTKENRTTSYKIKKESCKQKGFNPTHTFRFGRAFKDGNNFGDGTDNYILGGNNCAGLQINPSVHSRTSSGSRLSSGLLWTSNRSKDEFAEVFPLIGSTLYQDFVNMYYITGQLGKDELSSVKEIKAYGPHVEAITLPEDSETTSGEEESEFEDTDFSPEDFGKITPEEWWTELKESIDGKTYLEATSDTHNIFTKYSDVNTSDYLIDESGIANIKEWDQLPPSMQSYLSNYYENTVWPNSDGYKEYNSYIN